VRKKGKYPDNIKKKKAVALEYNKNDLAPKIIAKGQGKVAERIIEVAENENIPVHEDEEVVSTLSQLDLGDYIPPELYEVVAEILTFTDDLDRIKAKIF